MDILLQRVTQGLYRTGYSGSQRLRSYRPCHRRIPTAISQRTHGSSPACSYTLGTGGDGSARSCYQPQLLCCFLRSPGCGGCSCAFPKSTYMYSSSIRLDSGLLNLLNHPVNRKRRLYWNYLWNHPSHVPTPERAIPDASDALTWFYVCATQPLRHFTSLIALRLTTSYLARDHLCRFPKWNARSYPELSKKCLVHISSMSLSRTELTIHEILVTRLQLPKQYFLLGFFVKSAASGTQNIMVNIP